VYASADLIGKVEKAQRWPSTALVDDCEAVLDSGGVLPRLYALAIDERSTSSARSRDDGSANVARSMAVIVFVPVHDAVELFDVVDQGTTPLPPSSGIHVRRAGDAAGDVVDLASARARRIDRVAGGTVAVARRH